MRTTTRQLETRAFAWNLVRLLLAEVLIAALAFAHPIRRIADASKRNVELCVATRTAGAREKKTRALQPAERYTVLGDCAAST